MATCKGCGVETRWTDCWCVECQHEALERTKPRRRQDDLAHFAYFMGWADGSRPVEIEAHEMDDRAEWDSYIAQCEADYN